MNHEHEPQNSNANGARHNLSYSDPKGAAGESGTSAWRVIWLKVIARAWKEPKFEEDLLANPRLALRDAFQFDLPIEINLKVVKVTDPSPTLPAYRGDKGTTPPAEIVLPLPPRPAAVEDHAVALSDLLAYNNNAGVCADPCCG